MRLLVTGSQVPDLPAFKRLLLVAEEVAFLDRPSVTFQDWGTIGRASDIRRFKVDDLPVSITAHEPPSGPAEGLYQPYISADLGNPRFLQEIFDGLHDDSFAWRFIQPKAQHGDERTLGTELRTDLLTDPSLPTLNLSDQPIAPMFTGKVGTKEHRRALFKSIAVEASIMITSTLAVTAETALQPVTEDPRLARLLAMRSTDDSYVRQSSPASGPLAIAVATALIPDEVLQAMTMENLFDYRRKTKDAYAAWSTEINRLALRISDMDPAAVSRELPAIIHGEFKPRILDYRNELKAMRDKMFGELVRKVTTWNVPSLSLAYLSGLSVPAAIALFAGTLAPAVPDLDPIAWTV